jgi:malate permease and related proteins
MHIFTVVVQSVLVLLGIGVIGFLITRRNLVPENVLGFLSTLAIDIALPCTVFANILVNFNPAGYPAWWQLPLWWLAFTAILLVLTLLGRLASAKETRAEFGMSLFYQNGIFFPLIILSGVFAPDTPYIAQLFIFIMFHPTLMFGTYHLFFRKSAGTPMRWQRVFNPVLIATIIAIIIQLIHVQNHLPGFVIDIFKILGAMALPLVMIILGGSLYLDFQQKGKFYFSETIKFIIIKNIIFPLVFICILALLKPHYNIALLFLLQAAVPPVTSVPIFAQRAGGQKSITTQFVFASFVASMLTIPAVFSLFNVFFPTPV